MKMDYTRKRKVRTQFKEGGIYYFLTVTSKTYCKYDEEYMNIIYDDEDFPWRDKRFIPNRKLYTATKAERAMVRMQLLKRLA